MRAASSLIVAAALLLALPAAAQDDTDGLTTAPPAMPQRRITADQPTQDQDILTTHAPSALPWQPPTQPLPGAPPVVVPAHAAPQAPTLAKPGLPATMPFGHGSGWGNGGPAAAVPSGPHTAAAVPVENIDRVETSEPAAPTPVAPGANPANDDPAQPTDLTAPLFNAPDNGAPRTVVIRALNKVTAQSVLLEGRPGDTLKFGQLIIVPVICRASDPTSQADYAGLLDIKEAMPGKPALQPLFHGWMYASSPSINALEHPVYDISMVECLIVGAKKVEEKQEKAPAKKPNKK